MLELLPCPEPACRVPAEIVDRWSWRSSDGPVAHVKTLCLAGHWFAMPAEALAVQHALPAFGEHATTI